MQLRVGAAMAGAALAAAFLRPVPVAADRFQIGFPSEIHIEDVDGGRLTLRITEDGRTLKVDAHGRFQLNDDETDIERVSPDGTFRLEDRRWGRTSHRYEIRGLPDGGVERTYRRGGDVHELDAEGREWLAGALRVVILNTDFGLEHHLERVLDRDGLDAAVAEVESIGGNHAQRKGYRHILEHAANDSSAAVRVVESAGRHISDHELAELIMDATDGNRTDAMLHACAAATDHMGSDHERARVLIRLLEYGPVSAATAAAIVTSATRIGSDHERAGALVAVADSGSLDAALAPAFFEALGDIGSDREKRRTLVSVLARESRDPAILQGVVHAASRIGSDHERSEVLSEIGRQGGVDPALAPVFFESAGGIGSDHEHARVLIAVAQFRTLEPEVLEPLLEDTATIGSDVKKADVLEEVIRSQKVDGEIRSQLLRTADTIGSDSARRRVHKVLDDRSL